MIGMILSRLTAYLWPIVGIAAAALLLGIGVQTKRVAWAKAETMEVKNAWQLDRAQAQAAMLAQTEAYRAEEQRRAAAHQEIIDEAERKTVVARADAAVADAASGQLRSRVAALVAQARAAAGNPPAAQGSPPADDPGVLLADVFSRIDARAGELARYADAAAIAGQACERAYIALTPQGTGHEIEGNSPVGERSRVGIIDLATQPTTAPSPLTPGEGAPL